MTLNTENNLKDLHPLKKRILVGLSLIANKDGNGDYQSLYSLHKITKVPLAKINALLNELHQEGAITLYSNNPDLKETA